MAKKETRRKKISFTATRKAPKKVQVSFTTRKGEKVSFHATGKVPKKIKEVFYAKIKSGKKK